MAFAPAFSHQSFNYVNPFSKEEEFGEFRRKKDVEALVAGHVRAVTNRGSLRWLFVAVAGFLAFETGRVITEGQTADEVAEWLRSLNRPRPQGRPPKGVAVPLRDFGESGQKAESGPTRRHAIPDPEMSRPQVRDILRRQPRPRPDIVDLDPPDQDEEPPNIWAWFERKYGKGSVLSYLRSK